MRRALFLPLKREKNGARDVCRLLRFFSSLSLLPPSRPDKGLNYIPFSSPFDLFSAASFPLSPSPGPDSSTVVGLSPAASSPRAFFASRARGASPRAISARKMRKPEEFEHCGINIAQSHRAMPLTSRKRRATEKEVRARSHSLGEWRKRDGKKKSLLFLRSSTPPRRFARSRGPSCAPL